MSESNSSKFIGGFQFRIALKRIAILNGIFPELYSSHKDKLIESCRKELGTKNKKYQKGIFEIISKYETGILTLDELHQLEGLNQSDLLYASELKKYDLRLPMPFPLIH